jgi:hypothetical protein
MFVALAQQQQHNHKHNKREQRRREETSQTVESLLPLTEINYRLLQFVGF